MAPHIGAALMLQDIIDNERVGPTVFGMNWSRVSVGRSNVPLLTSDRPLDMPIGLGQKNAYIALPIGPYDLFVAANDPDIAKAASEENPTSPVKKMNFAVVRRARLFVWGAWTTASSASFANTSAPSPIGSSSPKSSYKKRGTPRVASFLQA
jgi:hypothetical protein